MKEERLNSLLAQVPLRLQHEVAASYEMGLPRIEQEEVDNEREKVLADIQQLSESIAKGHCNWEQLQDIGMLLETANEMSNIEQYSLTHRFIYGSVLVGDVGASIDYEPLWALPFGDSLYYCEDEDIERFRKAKECLNTAKFNLYNIRPIELPKPEGEPHENPAQQKKQTKC